MWSARGGPGTAVWGPRSTRSPLRTVPRGGWVSLTPLYRWGSSSLGRLRNSPMVTWLVSDQKKFKLQRPATGKWRHPALSVVTCDRWTPSPRGLLTSRCLKAALTPTLIVNKRSSKNTGLVNNEVNSSKSKHPEKLGTFIVPCPFLVLFMLLCVFSPLLIQKPL